LAFSFFIGVSGGLANTGSAFFLGLVKCGLHNSSSKTCSTTRLLLRVVVLDFLLSDLLEVEDDFDSV
jgi:hypothetical protein